MRHGHNILNKFKFHTHPNVLLGRAATSRMPKAGALMHGVLLENGSLLEADGWRLGCVCGTMDQGTEQGVALLPGVEIAQVLPPWRLHLPHQIEEDIGGTRQPAQRGDHWRHAFRNHFFYFMVPIAGFLHVLNGISEAFTQKLELWPDVCNSVS